MNRKIIFLLLILTISTNLCFASFLGVSPSTREVNVSQGGTNYTTFMISGPSDEQKELYIQSDSNFINLENKQITINGSKQIGIDISVPANTKVGTHETKLNFCVETNDTSDIRILKCVEAKIYINVIDQQNENKNPFVVIGIAISTIILTIVFSKKLHLK